MKRICFFNSNKAWGGGEKWNHHFALLLRDAGYTVYVVTNKNSALHEKLVDEPEINLSEFSISNLSFLNPISFLKLRNFFKKNKIDSVIMALPSDLKTAGTAAKAAGVPQIIYRRGIAVPIRNTKLNRYLFSKIIDVLIVNSYETKKMVLKNAPNLINDDRIKLIYNGFSVKEFDAQKTVPLLLRKNNEIIIGNAARLTIQKGQKYLIEAAAILRDKGINFKVVIAGKGELQDELMGLVRKFHLEERVQFPGFIEDMKAFYTSIDIFCLPSLWEGFGYALVEAMTLKKPVVAFKISSNPEVVEDKVTGILVESGNAKQLANALEELIQNKELRLEMGQHGREKVLKNFDTPLVLGKLIDIIEI